LKRAVYETAMEVLGTQRRRNLRRLKIWDEDLLEAIEKKHIYRKWRSSKNNTDFTEYKKIRAKVRRLSRQRKRKS
jgi:hypothetical protein